MLKGLQDRLGSALKTISGQATISEANIDASLREVRRALLEGDVHLDVVKSFTAHVKEKALGLAVSKSLTPGQEFLKIVKDELTLMLGSESADLKFSGSPAVIMMVGLQGSGKTTSTAKLAKFLKEKGRSPYIIPADFARPAAVLQLMRLSEQIGVDCFPIDTEDKNLNAPDVVKEALRIAKIKRYDTAIIDTQGRMHVDDDLMSELKVVNSIAKPIETLYVADSMGGQDILNTVEGFSQAVSISGIILTKFDSDSRGGAALSCKHVTGKPIKFIGTGEKVDAFEVFHPDRVASRLLGMGDMMSLIEKVESTVDKDKTEELEKKFKKNQFTLEDFRDQIQSIRKMGSIESMLSMVPGFDAMKNKKKLKVDDKDFVKVEAIINSMTPKERVSPKVLNGKRRLRIAKGSGTKVSDVNRVIKQFNDMLKMMKKMKKGSMPKGGGFPGGGGPQMPPGMGGGFPGGSSNMGGLPGLGGGFGSGGGSGK